MVTTRDSLGHATTRLRGVRSAMTTIRDVYRLDRDPLYKGLDEKLSQLSSDLRKARLASEIMTAREAPRALHKPIRKGDEIMHIPTGFYATILRVEGMDLRVAWLDARNNVHSTTYPVLECRRVSP
jgi:hypothetical protein